MDNPFDDLSFFEAYRHFRSTDAGHNKAVERPALLHLLPKVAGLQVLDLGCGWGELTLELVARGAANVVAIDSSVRMLSEAAGKDDPRIQYRHSAMELLEFPPHSFDLIVSSMALHYVETIDTLFARAKRWLTATGTFVYSIEHPFVTAGLAGAPDAFASYFAEGPRAVSWLGRAVLKCHFTVSTWLSVARAAGFATIDVVEPVVPLLYPEFLVLRAHSSK